MAKPKPKLCSLLLLLLLTSAAGDDPSGFVYAGCSLPKYTPGSPYDFNVGSLLSSLSNAAAFSLYAKFTSAAATRSPPVHGLFQCLGDLSISDCSSCVRSAISRLPSLCESYVAASLQLRACFLRYGNDTFFGCQDTAVRYKTCSTGDGRGGGAAFVAARDAAFYSLAATPPTGSYYRVAAAGSVQADAQCVGDLSAGDCSDCIAAAALQFKASCDGAGAGEAYLGKCFIRYSAGGALPAVGGPGGASSHNDDSQKLAGIGLDENMAPSIIRPYITEHNHFGRIFSTEGKRASNGLCKRKNPDISTK